MRDEGFLIDTTVWVDYLRGRDDSVRDRVASMVNEDRAFTAEIIILEILRGAKSEKEYRMLREDFLALPRLPMDPEAWETAWRNSFLFRKKGLNIPIVDTLVSSLAIRHDCTLVHADRHFSQLAEYVQIKALQL